MVKNEDNEKDYKKVVINLEKEVNKKKCDIKRKKM